jgi:RNA polymerase sigma-70 factor (ECF subfamily)
VGTEGDLAPDTGEPGIAEAVSERLDIDAALQRLPVEFRTVVVLRDQLGMDYAAIAATLEIPVGTVRSRLARGRGALADLLGNRRDLPTVQEHAP